MSEYCVYRHVFPNGKSYIGISKDAQKRWNYGNGYNTQPKISRAIHKYGWANVKHEMLAERLTKELAQQLEKHYIAEYDSIRNGYNTSIGGDDFNACYLNSYVLSMIRGAKRYFEDVKNSIVELSDGDRLNKDAAEFWNEASRAVCEKHKKYSATSEEEVNKYWYYIGQYCDLYIRMQNGEDVSGWSETPYEKAIADYLSYSEGDELY